MAAASDITPVTRISVPAIAGIHAESEVAESALPGKRENVSANRCLAEERVWERAPTSGIGTVGVLMIGRMGLG